MARPKLLAKSSAVWQGRQQGQRQAQRVAEPPVRVLVVRPVKWLVNAWEHRLADTSMSVQKRTGGPDVADRMTLGSIHSLCSIGDCTVRLLLSLAA